LLPGTSRNDNTTWAQQTFVSLELEGDCTARGALEVQTSLFFGSPGYSLLIDAQTEHGRSSGVLTMATDGWTEPPASSWFGTLLRFLSAGIWHVAIGYDHVAFLLLLLLPSVLHGSRSGWAAATSLREVARDLARIVTAFTVAHSITLGLSATGSVHVPAQTDRGGNRRIDRRCRPAEPLPVGGRVAAQARVRIRARTRLWLRERARESGAGQARLAPMLAGFNLGVEVAQLAIVALTLPLLWRLSRTQQYSQRLMPALSIVTAMTGAIWFVNRLSGQA
jgi:hypothetical protein